jgi:hypothetical protein
MTASNATPDPDVIVSEIYIAVPLEPTQQGTLLRICHSGFAAHPELAHSCRGWPRTLGWLQALVERGETVANRKFSGFAQAGRKVHLWVHGRSHSF